ncbi:MAG: hypothetical protein AAF432_00940 [Planctomycetota bacterium]
MLFTSQPRTPSVDGLDIDRYDASVLTPAGSSRRARREHAARVALVHAVDERLGDVLRAGEVVQHLAVGTLASELEFLMLGGLVDLTARTVMVITSNRIVMLQVDRRNRPRHTMAQVRHEYITRAASTRDGALRVHLVNGETLTLHKAGRELNRSMRDVINTLACPRTVDGGEAVVCPLCPSCGTAASDTTDSCRGCGAAFMPRHTAGALSLLCPGLGELYAGYRAMGVFAIVATVGMWGLWISRVAHEPTKMNVMLGLMAAWHVVSGTITWNATRAGRRLQSSAWRGPRVFGTR